MARVLVIVPFAFGEGGLANGEAQMEAVEPEDLPGSERPEAGDAHRDAGGRRGHRASARLTDARSSRIARGTRPQPARSTRAGAT